MVVLAILRPNLRPHLRSENFFFFSKFNFLGFFFGWNLPGITMSLESLHSYFGITIKSQKNDENFDLSTFDSAPEINIEWLQNHGNPH